MISFQNEQEEINYKFVFEGNTGSYEWSLSIGNQNTSDALYGSPALIQNVTPDVNCFSADQSNRYLAVGDPESGFIEVYSNPSYTFGGTNQYVKNNRLLGAGVSNISGMGYYTRTLENLIAGGAPYTNDNKGAAFLFRESNAVGLGVTGSSSWGQINALSGTEESGYFGCMVDAIFDRGTYDIAISATGENNESGAVYFYKNAGSSFVRKITPTLDGVSKFGKALRFTQAEGIKYLAIAYDINGTGKVDMYKENFSGENDLHQYRTIGSDFASNGDMFGYYIDDLDDALFISSPNELGTGAVYYYLYNSGEGFFEKTQRIVPDDPEDGCFFGKNISFDNQDGIITSNQSSGKAYIYDFENEWENISKITGNNTISGSFGGSETGSFCTSLIGSALTVGYHLEHKVDYFTTGASSTESSTELYLLGKSGKIYDQEDNFIYGWGPEEKISIHGAIFKDHYNIYINNYVCNSIINKSDKIINAYEVSGKENLQNYELSFYGSNITTSQSNSNFFY